ncbi:FAD-dependent oxidoreductase [Actinocorallia longicatena]|uniref:N-methyl-L-tryptophan oxidase n=1 Tax=Actinocorallia longicatena TaxID=111803 RepID=A0ABP6Q4T5_9ACTN
MDSMDVAVVGLGLAGAASARALSRRGRSVTVFEAFAPGHRNGSSHGSARIFRRGYLDPFYIELTGRARTLWHQVEAESGERLLTVTGGLDHGSAREPARLVELLREHGVAAELWTAGEAAAHRPGVVFDGPVVFDPECGVLDPERTIAALLALSGARVHYETPVRRLEPDGHGVLLHTDEGVRHARTVVVAAGGWTVPLLPDLAGLLPLTVGQQQAFYFRPGPGRPWPTLVHDSDDGDLIYALPEGPLMKIGEHSPGTPTTAEARDFVVDPAARERVTAYVARWLPGLDPVPAGETSCLYTWVREEDFVIDRSGDIIVCSACSGHGAKFTPLLGELVADLADGGPPLPRFAFRS